jgi:hypothetical protein
MLGWMRRHIVVSMLLGGAIGFLAVATTSADTSPVEVGVVWLLLVLAFGGLIALIRWLYRVTFERRKKLATTTETPLFNATPLSPSHCPRCLRSTEATDRFCPECGYQLRSR